MSATGETENETVPGTVFSPRQVRILKIVVIVMGVLLVGGFAFVLAAIVYQASHPSQNSAASAALGGSEEGRAIHLPVARDAAVTSLALDGNRLAVHLNGAEGPEIVVIDLGSGKVAARIKLKPQ